MTLRFNKSVYHGEAVDEAVKALAEWATFELSEEPNYWVVAVAAGDDVDVATVGGELSNYALGLTIERRGS